MKSCSKNGKSEKAGACGSYSVCESCQYRFFYIAVMREEYGDKLVLTADEQAWVDNVYSKLSETDLRYVKSKYAPETPTVYRPRQN